MRNRIVCAATLMLAMTTAHSAPDPAELQCGAKFNTAEGVERCLRDALSAAEKKLMQAQDDVRQSLKQAQPRFKELQDKTLQAIDETMIQAQEAWRTFKEKNCEAFRRLHDTIGEKTMEDTACQLRMVRERTRELMDEAKFWAEKFPAKE